MSMTMPLRQFTNRPLGRGILFVAVLLPMIAIIGVASGSVAHAAILHPDPGANGEPAIPINPDKNALENCVTVNGRPNGPNGPFYSPGIASWVSQSGFPSAVSNIPVQAGQTSLALDYNQAIAVCSTDSTGVQVETKIGKASAGVSGIQGKTVTIPIIFNAADKGFYERKVQTFNFSPPGGFTVSRDYTINLDQQTMQEYNVSGGTFVCNTKPGKPVLHEPAGFSQIGKCDVFTVPYTFHVIVNQKPDHAPKLSKTFICSTKSSITPTFSDQDGRTQAQLITPTSTITIPQAKSGVPIDITTYTGFSSAAFKLQVRDVPPGGTEGSGDWDAATTQNFSIGPCGSGLSCNGITTDPAIPEPGTHFSLVVSYTYTGSNPPNPASQTLSATGPGNWSGNWNGNALNPKATQTSTNGGTLTLTLVGGLSVPNAGTYNVSWAVTVGAVSKTCSGSIGGGGTFTAAFKPYFQVYNGDISAGGGIPTITNAGIADCTVPGNPEAGIVGWNGESAPWSGAGVQYGARAVKNIYDFASSYSVTSATGRPVALSFSNVGASAGSGNYGGNYGASSPGCDQKLMSQKADLKVNHDDTLSDLMSSAGININNVTGHHVIYVSGNVVIDQPVTYANTGGYGSVSNIPSFKLIVSGGDISIISAVSHIDGSYYALPTQAKPLTGTIYTCTDPSQPYKYGLASPEVGADNFNTCAHQQLVVNGSLAAKQIWLLRSCGTLSDSTTETVGPVFVSGPSGNIHCSSTSHAGEVINYDPEVWMSNGGGLDQTTGSYNTIQNLPPVL